jgi:hypothetical protein
MEEGRRIIAHGGWRFPWRGLDGNDIYRGLVVAVVEEIAGVNGF